MKKFLMGVLVIATLCATVLMPVASAQTMTVYPELTLKLTGSVPKDPDSFTFALIADDKNNPMPEGKKGGYAKLTLKGAGTAGFGEITFNKVGVYTYTIRQVCGRIRSIEKYDTSIYTLKVIITNAEGGGLESTVVLHKDKTSLKPDEAIFCNEYKIMPVPTRVPGQPRTGVEDTWPVYLTGSLALLALSVGMLIIIARSRVKDEK